MKQCERKLSEDKLKVKKLREELWLMRLHGLIIRPTITLVVEYFK